MKKSITMLLAFVLVLGLCQCKKNVETISSVPTGVYITLDVEGGDKAIVDPHGGSNYASVTFEAGDVIYVGNNGAYCGYLTYNGTSDRFEGTIEPTSTDNTDYLHFYFMGNKGPVGSAPSSVYIADQTDRYPVISYGRSTYLYSSGTTNYSARLYNYCAIMRFDVTGASANDVVTITGMNNIVAVDFSKNNGSGDPVNPYSYSKTTSGDIRLHTEANDERWAILLPQAEVLDATASAGGYTHSSAFTVPAVSANGYYNNPVSVAINSYTPGEFSVDSSGTKVILAPANLQYTKSTGIWSFMGRQWSRVETDLQNVGDNYANQDVVGLFGWGTWGQGNNPLNTSENNSDYQWSTDFTGTLDGFDDWHTLTGEEWAYLIDNHTQGFSEVAGINGFIIRPDGNNTAVASSYTAEEWAAEETSGSVFLPAASYRVGTSVHNSYSGTGYYWSSSVSPSEYGDVSLPYYLMMGGFYVNPVSPTIVYVLTVDKGSQLIGNSVRLARYTTQPTQQTGPM